MLFRSEGATVTAVDAITVEVVGVPAATIGEMAARLGAVLHELAPLQGSLEDAYLEVTASAQEYRAQVPVSDGGAA